MKLAVSTDGVFSRNASLLVGRGPKRKIGIAAKNPIPCFGAIAGRKDMFIIGAHRTIHPNRSLLVNRESGARCQIRRGFDSGCNKHQVRRLLESGIGRGQQFSIQGSDGANLRVIYNLTP